MKTDSSMLQIVINVWSIYFSPFYVRMHPTFSICILVLLKVLF